MRYSYPSFGCATSEWVTGVIVVLALAACSGGAQQQPGSTATPSASPLPGVPSVTQRSEQPPATEAQMPSQQPVIPDLANQVSSERLMGDVRALSAIHSRNVNSPGVAQGADYIYGQFTTPGGSLRATYQPFPLIWNGISTTQRNVIATLPGSDPAAGTVLVGAHYDSRTHDLNDVASPAPGANDNASGVAAVLEVARLLADQSPRASIIFVAFSGEEVGRQGSKYFLQSLSSRPNFRAVIVLDIVGRNDPSGKPLRIYSAGPGDSPSRQLARFMAAQATAVIPGFLAEVEDAPDRPGRYSDHLSFSDAGYPAIRLIQPTEDPWNHSGGDTADHLTPEYLRQVTQVVLAGVTALARGNAMFAP